MLQLVLTGGPCGGKTTGQARLATFFENLGWKGRLSIHSRHLDHGPNICKDTKP
jgi:hypothetical protein